MPSWVRNESLWERAKRIAGGQGRAADYGYITAIYKRMGGTIGAALAGHMLGTRKSGGAFVPRVVYAGDGPPEGWIELPESYGESVYGAEIFKGAGHKYIKRVPYTKKNGKKGYRYYYKVHHGGGVHHDDHFVAGAAFQHEGGHYHITSVDGDHVTIRHDETGKVQKMRRDKLSKLLASHHKEGLDSHKKKLKQEHADAMKYGSPKQQAAAKKRAQKFGVDVGEEATPKATAGDIDAGHSKHKVPEQHTKVLQHQALFDRTRQAMVSTAMRAIEEMPEYKAMRNMRGGGNVRSEIQRAVNERVEHVLGGSTRDERSAARPGQIRAEMKRRGRSRFWTEEKARRATHMVGRAVVRANSEHYQTLTQEQRSALDDTHGDWRSKRRHKIRHKEAVEAAEDVRAAQVEHIRKQLAKRVGNVAHTSLDYLAAHLQGQGKAKLSAADIDAAVSELARMSPNRLHSDRSHGRSHAQVARAHKEVAQVARKLGAHKGAKAYEEHHARVTKQHEIQQEQNRMKQKREAEAAAARKKSEAEAAGIKSTQAYKDTLRHAKELASHANAAGRRENYQHMVDSLQSNNPSNIKNVLEWFQSYEHKEADLKSAAKKRAHAEKIGVTRHKPDSTSRYAKVKRHSKASAAKRAAAFAPTDDSGVRYRKLAGMYRAPGADHVVATDGHRIAHIPAGDDIGEGRHSTHKKVTINARDPHMLSTGSMQAMLDNLGHRKGSTHTMNAEHLHDLASRAVAMGHKDGGNNQIRLTSREGTLAALGHANDGSGGHEEVGTHIGASGSSPSVTQDIGLNAKFIMDALKGAKGDVEVTLGEDHRAPIHIRRGDGEEHTIMPLRL